jgi:uncharacterized protein (DUF885 family)
MKKETPLKAVKRSNIFAVLACLVSASTSWAAPSADQRLDKLVDAYWEEYLALNPVFATRIGDHRYDDQYPIDIGPEWIEKALATERRYLAALGDIDANTLSPPARLSYDVFKARRDIIIESARFPGELLPVDQFSNPAADLAVLGSGSGAHPFATAQDYRNFMSRMTAFQAWIEQAIVNMRAGAAKGITQPRPLVEKILPQLEALIVAQPEDSVFYEPLRSLPADLDEPARAQLTQEYRATIVQTLAAYQRLLDFMKSEYLPKARTTVGWSALPDGKEWYTFFVRLYTTTQMQPDAIHELGLKEVARIESEMDSVRRQVGFKGDLPAFFHYLKEDPRFYFKNEAELLAGYRALKTRIDALLPKMFADFPKADYEIRAVEPFRAQSAAGAFYERAAADGSRPGIFYVNTFDLKGQPKYGMETLSLHEAAPGHHFQLSIQQELTNLPRFRRFDFYVAYTEGWALYCESIGKELGLFTDPYQYYGRLNDEMLRAMRLVVDTGLHAKGWSREQGIRYMTEHSSMAESDAVAEVERYIALPGQALGYKIGQLRISAMRARAQAALGPKFDIKQFHSVVLRDGSVPIDVLEAKVDRWIEQKRGGQ